MKTPDYEDFFDKDLLERGRVLQMNASIATPGLTLALILALATEQFVKLAKETKDEPHYHQRMHRTVLAMKIIGEACQKQMQMEADMLGEETIEDRMKTEQAVDVGEEMKRQLTDLLGKVEKKQKDDE